MVGRIGQNDDAGLRRQSGKRLGRAFDRVKVAIAVPEEVVEQGLACLHVDMLVVSRAIDVLEKRELVDLHFIAVSQDEPLEPLHEVSEHLVDIDDQQGATGIDFDRPGDFERGLCGRLDHD